MPVFTKKKILDLLAHIDLKDIGIEVMADDLVGHIALPKNKVGEALHILLNVPPDITPAQAKRLKSRVESALRGAKIFSTIVVGLATHKTPLKPSANASSLARKAQLQPKPAPKPTQRVHPDNHRPKGPKKIIEIASAKGGVGKTSLAVGLALVLASKYGKRVAVLDADIQGPNVPLMLGINEIREMNEATIVKPVRKNGIDVMSAAFFLSENAPAIWRGPILHKALDDLIYGTEWGDQDILIVDTPPGTGDVMLSLNRLMDIDGAIVVSKPDEASLSDMRRGVNMFDKMHIPVLGMIENMRDLQPNAPKYLSGGVEDEAHKLNLPFLGYVARDDKWPEAQHKGNAKILINDPAAPSTKSLNAIAERLLPILSL